MSTFWLDKYEVTPDRFNKFRDAWTSGWRPLAGSGKHTHLNGGNGLTNSAEAGFEQGWDTAWDGNVAPTGQGFGTYPYLEVNWYEAYAFCIWDGGFLPSEAEWNYAAAGGAEQRVYPWSVPANSTAFDESRVVACFGPTPPATPVCFPLPVGSKPAGNGKWGHADLSGNVEEWTLDAYTSPYVLPCEDCSYLPTVVSSRVRRGDSFVQFWGGRGFSASYRYDGDPVTHDYSGQGVRCARSPL